MKMISGKATRNAGRLINCKKSSSNFCPTSALKDLVMDQNEKSRFPDMPARIKRLRVDHRGYPVPYFVAWINGRPDHRVVDGSKLWPAMNDRRCWICGQRLGANLAFALGP